MTQDRTSGAAANEWGRRTARALAERLGATTPTGVSNACLLDESRVVIKCAAVSNNQVGVTFSMLGRLDAIIGAFQRDDGKFELWSLAPSIFRTHMRPTRSRGTAAGKVGLVRRDLFQAKGKALGTLSL